MTPILPECQDCGACCANERKWVEVTDSDLVRIGNHDFVEPGDIAPWAMRIQGETRQCVALLGIVGIRVECNIYNKRPQVCRDVAPGSPICLYSLGYHRIPVRWK